MRVGKKVRANLGAPVHRDEAMQHRVAADLRVFVYEAVGTDVGAFADLRVLGNHRSRVNSRGIRRRLVEKFDSSCEVQIGVFAAQRGNGGRARRSLQGDARLKQNG